MDGDVARTPRDVHELRIIPGAQKALARLRRARFRLLVVSNQPDVARGDVGAEGVERINAHLTRALPIDGFYVCPHDNHHGCGCRKPKPGLILTGARDWGVDLGRSCLVGDRWTDLAAAAAAGIDGILIESVHSWRDTTVGGPPAGLRPRYAAPTLEKCVDFILDSGRYGTSESAVGRPGRRG